MIEVLEGMLRGQVKRTDLAYLLMDIGEHLNCTVQKYFWVSKYDDSVIEEIEPKIIDAYDCVVYLKGKQKDLNGVKEVYERKADLYEQLSPINFPLTEPEIHDLSYRFFASL